MEEVFKNKTVTICIDEDSLMIYHKKKAYKYNIERLLEKLGYEFKTSDPIIKIELMDKGDMDTRMSWVELDQDV